MPIDFTIGADPELTLMSGNRVIVGSDYASEDDSEEFGVDGNGVTFELRPQCSKEPIDVVNNIHDIFVRKVIDNSEFLKFQWHAGGWCHGYPMGGHVHFGIKAPDDAGYGKYVNYLDHYVGICSLLLEVKAGGKRRRSDGYGCMGDNRIQPWGFEYRPMSSWLTSPYIAAAMLCLSKTVMYEVLNNQNFEWHQWVMADDFIRMDKDRLRGIFPRVWADITKMHLYQLYKPYLDLIYFLVTNQLTWMPASNMKESWGVVNMVPYISNKINLDVIWHRYNMEQ